MCSLLITDNNPDDDGDDRADNDGDDDADADADGDDDDDVKPFLKVLSNGLILDLNRNHSIEIVEIIGILSLSRSTNKRLGNEEEPLFSVNFNSFSNCDCEDVVVDMDPSSILSKLFPI
ncbi:hypothetical protein Glove_313g24 [Diversispora epigaea]|uniref:Uncharacterized protein n=1 Tax=Diversispora epigaea TaxID=1348612 RepID=A0A397HWZ3_9GLOM|nr:hypothetical protein Glove_313g24 [Diversispora epigaea]